MIKGIYNETLCELDIAEGTNTMCEVLFNILTWTKT
jgi:hypothetical protein